jgi:hypothetical protein
MLKNNNRQLALPKKAFALKKETAVYSVRTISIVRLGNGRDLILEKRFIERTRTPIYFMFIITKNISNLFYFSLFFVYK